MHLDKLSSLHSQDRLLSINEEVMLEQNYGSCGPETIENVVEEVSKFEAHVDKENALIVHIMNLLLGDSLPDDSF